MKAVIVNYRGSYKTKKMNQFVLIPEGTKTKDDANKLVGKRVVWIIPNKKTKKMGTITAPHGINGAVRVRFANGLPGQALGTKAEII